MPALDLVLNGDNAWPDLYAKHATGKVINITDVIGIAVLPGGMQSGKESIAIRIDLPDGRVVIAETSWAAFAAATQAIAARYDWPT